MVQKVVSKRWIHHILGLLYNRNYGRLLIGSLLIAAVFLGAFLLIVALLLPLLMGSNDTLFTKIGTMTSIGGVFLGTYIALWLINQNRTRRIEEAYFYKMQLLANLYSLLQDISIFFDDIKKTNDEEKNWDEINRRIEIGRKDFKNHALEIKSINSNEFIPANIKTSVNLLLKRGEQSFAAIRTAKKNQRLWVEQFLLRHLDNVLQSDYFAADGSDDVQNLLNEIREYQENIEKSL